MKLDVSSLTFFSEDRLHRDQFGRPCSVDRHLAGGGWARGLDSLQGARFAARTASFSLHATFPVTGVVVALPYYEGFGFFRRLPILVVHIWLAVVSSRAIAVRLPGLIGTLAVAAASLIGRPIVIELVGDVNEVLATGAGGAHGRSLARLAAFVTRWAVRRGAVVRYVTYFHLQSHYPARPGASTLGFSDVALSRDDFCAVARLKSARPTIVAVGTHEQRYKGHDVLLRAIARMAAATPEIRCIIAGSGRHHGELRELAQSLSIQQNVEFRGQISTREQLHAVLDESWVFAMPSRTEGLPRAMVEAMARSLPCVGTRVGGIPELLEDCMLVPSDDADALAEKLQELLADPEMRAAQGRRNYDAAKRLNDYSRASRQEWLSLLSELRGEG